MLSVGDKFPAFSLQGINEKNEFVRVEVDEGFTPHKKDWVSRLFLSKRLYIYLSNRNSWHGCFNRAC